ncbi:MAG: vacuolar protein sorting/targeting protein PEP1 [Bogoriella megaspora]|nr:MAG: vacuolar protein sorting/targeting protein PEP1 [Bogoriella megaspora]
MKNRLGILIAVLGLWLASALAKDKPAPKITRNEFDGRLANLRYFEDSDVVTVLDIVNHNLYRSVDAGASWDRVKDIEEGQALEVIHHEFNNQVAICLGELGTHWITKDQGKTWHAFEIPDLPKLPPVSFHADDPDKIIINTQHCKNIFTCDPISYYTTDGFKTEAEVLRKDSEMCIWARTHELFKTGSDKHDADQTVCVVRGRYSDWSSDYRLVTSTDYFKTETEPDMEDNRPIAGIANISGVKGYLVAAARADGTKEMALYVTNDGANWRRAIFGDSTIEEDSYTVLESTNYSIQVDVRTSTTGEPIGSLYTSNSNGSYFTRNIDHTNRNTRGYVDFEKVQNIQGIVIVNIVDNWEDIEDSWRGEKKLVTRISFDDGRTFRKLKVDKEKGSLHLHSVTDQRNSGRVFSSPAPGLVMGNGNVGKYLEDRDRADVYVSDDAGLTWRKALDNSHMYEFGDQGSVIMAIREKPDVESIVYSLNHGKDWDKVSFDDFKIFPIQLTTVPDSTSRKFIINALDGDHDGAKAVLIHVDFDELHESRCSEKDFEEWHARVDEDGKPTCIMGHTQSYRRRKPDVECFIDEDFVDPVPEFEDCKCSDEDFECDYGFQRSKDGKQCEPIGALTPPKDECKDGKGTFMGSSGWRKIPGNTCESKGGVKKDEPIERDCSDTVKEPASNEISHTLNTFRASRFSEYYYLERKKQSNGPKNEEEDEVIVMRTDKKVFLTRDHGKSWEQIIKEEEVNAIYPHQYFHETVYFITPSATVYYTHNRGGRLGTFEAPEVPNQVGVEYLRFHPDNRDWLIWTGAENCRHGLGDDCHTIAQLTEKGGRDWEPLLPFVRKCMFVASERRKDSEQLVYCEQFQNEDEDAPLQLVSSTDWFKHKTVHFDDVVNFATMSEYIIVATKDEDEKSLRVDASIDGSDFANAQFPLNFKVEHQQAYTVLDSSTHAVFLHVTVNNRPEQEYGSILKSNSNGTSYVQSISAVNRDTRGYVDFEKMQGLEGVAIVNIVSNVDEANQGRTKLLQTVITHNDGAEWALLEPPKQDTNGKEYGCRGTGLDECSLHLHGYTERSDPRHTFSSPSAAGIMMGRGNVGASLGRKEEADTFITTDGGIKWKEVMKGNFLWEYGDSGSIIVIVQENEPTDIIYYTLDRGDHWEKYKFSDNKMSIYDVSSVPSDTSRNFLLWGKAASGGDVATVNLDFTGLTDKACNLIQENPHDPESDFELWQPKHPMQEKNCLFGHVAEYYRKKSGRNCFIGRMDQKLHGIAYDCECTRQDFECDYNYERKNDGSCGLVEGYSPPDPSRICTENSSVVEYWDPTGYRKVPLSTCKGGKDLDHWASKSHPCPDHIPEWEDRESQRKGLSGWGVFGVVLVAGGVAAAVGYWVYKNWDGKFGRIRLGDGGAGGGLASSASGAGGQSPWIKYPVAAVSGVVAVVGAIPAVAASAGRGVMSLFGRGGGSRGAYSGIGRGGYGGRTYTSRQSFARGRDGFAAVDAGADEGELLGSESDEEV